MFMKIRKCYQLSSDVAVAVKVEAAKKQLTASEVIENAVCVYLDLDKKKLRQPA